MSDVLYDGGLVCSQDGGRWEGHTVLSGDFDKAVVAYSEEAAIFSVLFTGFDEVNLLSVHEYLGYGFAVAVFWSPCEGVAGGFEGRHGDGGRELKAVDGDVLDEELVFE